MRPIASLSVAVRSERFLNASGLQMLRATWQYRGFVWGMVKREFQVRYLNSLLGSLWAVLNPLAMIIIYTVIFSQVMRARLPGVDDTLAYSLYLCAGLLPWTYFTELVVRCQTVFVEQAGLLKKMNFPRITLPIILLISSTINFAIIFGLFSVFLVVSGRFPGWGLLAFLPLLLIQQGFALGLGILLGTINVFYRDVGNLSRHLLRLWFYLSPALYGADQITSISQKHAWVGTLFALNPWTTLFNSYRNLMYGQSAPEWGPLLVLTIASLGLLTLAILFFKRVEPVFAKVL